jgi:hypothetical protein
MIAENTEIFQILEMMINADHLTYLEVKIMEEQILMKINHL